MVFAEIFQCNLRIPESRELFAGLFPMLIFLAKDLFWLSSGVCLESCQRPNGEHRSYSRKHYKCTFNDILRYAFVLTFVRLNVLSPTFIANKAPITLLIGCVLFQVLTILGASIVIFCLSRLCSFRSCPFRLTSLYINNSLRIR